MLRAELKNLSASDLDFNTDFPADPDCFSLSLAATIGVHGKEGGDLFYMTVCTPQWLAKEATGALFGAHHLIVPTYDTVMISQAIARFCERCHADTWEQLAQKLSFIGDWEFSSYTPFSGD